MKLRFVFLLLVVGLLGELTTQNAHSAPFVGKGQAPTGTSLPEIKKARALAKERARKDAFAQAIASLITEPGASQKRLLQQYEQWTRAYRILGEKNDGATLSMEIEVDINEAKLSKQLSASSTTSTHAADESPNPQALVIEDKCPKDVSQLLSRHRIAEHLKVRCQNHGYVDYTNVFASGVTLEGSGSNPQNFVASAIGFHRDEVKSMTIAAERAVTQLLLQIEGQGNGSFRLEVESSGPARCLRRLATTLQNSTVGVRRVDLVGILSNGVIVYQITGALNEDRFTTQLEGLQVPGCLVNSVSMLSPKRWQMQVHEQEQSSSEINPQQ